MKYKILASAFVVLVSACTQKAENIRPTYTSPATYSGLSCVQLANEAENLSARAHEATSTAHKRRRHDEAMVATGIVIFWPALFFTGGPKGNLAETQVAELKGQMEALETEAQQKNCKIDFNRR